MRLVAYLRVSTQAQAGADRYGLKSQRADVTAWAKVNGHRVVHWCTDEGVSGTVDALDRDGLTCALRALRDGRAQGLVVPRLDRLARSLSVQEAALAHAWAVGGRVFTVDSGEVLRDDPHDAMRTAMRQMVGVFGQLERAMIVSRMAKGRAAKAAAGGFAYGSPPFGWRAENGELVPDEHEQPILRLILRWKAEGLSDNAITKRLNAEGHRPKRAERFHSVTVGRILKRAAATST